MEGALNKKNTSCPRTGDKNSNSGVMIRKLLSHSLCAQIQIMISGFSDAFILSTYLSFPPVGLQFQQELNKRLSFMHTKTAIAPKNSSRCSDKSHTTFKRACSDLFSLAILSLTGSALLLLLLHLIWYAACPNYFYFQPRTPLTMHWFLGAKHTPLYLYVLLCTLVYSWDACMCVCVVVVESRERKYRELSWPYLFSSRAP